MLYSPVPFFSRLPFFRMDIASLILVLFLGVFPIATYSQDADGLTDEITTAIEQGSARELARFFGPNVDLTLPGSEGTFSKSQAEMILRTFFSRNIPESFSANHQGSSRDGSVYIIGTLNTTNEQSFRTYILIKRISDKYYLHQLQFEER